MSRLKVFASILLTVKLMLAVLCILLALGLGLMAMLAGSRVGPDALMAISLGLGVVGLVYPFSKISTKEGVTWILATFSALPFSFAMGYFPMDDLNAWSRKALVLLLPLLTVADVLVAQRLRTTSGNLWKRGSVLGSVILATTFVVGTSVSSFLSGRPYRPSAPAFDGDSERLHDTLVVPALDTPMPKGTNVVWCGSLQLGWNHLQKDVLHAPPQVQGVEAIVARLNQGQLDEGDLPADCYLATSGFCKDGVAERVVTAMKRRFQKDIVIDAMPPNAVLVYAYLQANVPFTLPFFDNRKPFLFKDSKGSETKVSSFGIEQKHEYAYSQLREQIEVLYQSRKNDQFELDEFVLDLCKDSSPCQIMLACVRPEATLIETINAVEKKTLEYAQKHKEKYYREFGITDVLLVPSLDWEIRHRFTELEGADKRFLNTGFGEYNIEKVVQTIHFKLDRSGAELASEGKMYCMPESSHFVFDRPFLIVVKKRGAKQSFFVMWVDNAELLCKP